MEYKAFTQRLAAAVGCSDDEAVCHVETVAAALARLLSEGTAVAVPGFGTFAPEFTPEREQGGTLWPPRVEATFTAGSRLRKSLPAK